MRPRGVVVGAVALALAAAACTGGIGNPALDAPASEQFDPDKLIDVLGPDSIRSVDTPAFEPIERAATWLSGGDPVVLFTWQGETRGYPLSILTRHEIVNDRFGTKAFSITYCPLCNSAIVYGREVGGRLLTFGVSGKLYQSDLVMFDRETESLWPQILGEAVSGPMRGAELEPFASSIVSFAAFREEHPDARVLVRPEGRDYGDNPYVEYDSSDGPYDDFFSGQTDRRLPAMERVVGVPVGDVARAYSYEALEKRGVPAALNDVVGDKRIVVFFGGDARSALDSFRIADGKVVGFSGVFEPKAGDRKLTFTARDGRITDLQTGSTWSILGRATAGPLEGETLTPVHHLDAFWFAWAAFVPFTELWRG